MVQRVVGVEHRVEYRNNQQERKRIEQRVEQRIDEIGDGVSAERAGKSQKPYVSLEHFLNVLLSCYRPEAGWKHSDE